MGGFGSGRGRAGKWTTNDYRALDVRWLARKGMLKAGYSGSCSWHLDDARPSALR